ncbi:hypothetical protein PFISCL1PPCAC_20249 [Pristionchus fissidentatus]|uniref:Uncharacterized protein n=1 Tax=Pristionchus fissidentatus TaxID=1538716 RepID=A0AAV5WD51_9BILA|nr:hypothetical protein PFISCL1PPCAC_20249 [Pristionchus fissidentatus]
MSEQLDRRTRTPNKRYKQEDESANIDVEEDIEVEEAIEDPNDADHIEEVEEEDGVRRIRAADDDGTLQETGDPSIFHCSEEKPTYFYLDILERAERNDLGLCDNIVQPPHGAILIYNIPKYTANGRSGLDYEKLRRCMRIDGYRMFNAGTHKVARSVILNRMTGNQAPKIPHALPGMRRERIAYRSYNTLFNTRDARKIDPRFKRKEYWFQDGKHILFHYIGDEDLAKKVAATTPHGNSRRNFAPYQRTDPLVLHEARNKILAGEKPEEVYASMRTHSDPTRVLKNIKQLRNVKERIDQERKKKAQSFYNIHSLHDMLKFEGTRQPFLHNITAVRVVAQLLCEPLIEEFINTANLNANQTQTQVFFYDSTYSSCGYQIALLSFRHDIFDEDPPVPLAFLVGEALTPRDHTSLFEVLLECFPRLKQLPLALASTVSVKLDHFWPELIEIRAWNDTKFQLKRELTHTLLKPGQEWRATMRMFEELSNIDNEAAFDKKWETLRERFDDDTLDLLENRFVPEWKTMCAHWTLEQKNIRYKDTRGIMRVPLGSFEYLVNAMNESKLHIDGVIGCLFYICQFTINEMERGYYQLGSFTIKEQWYSLTDEPHNIPRQPFAPYPDEIITFVNEVALNATFPMAKRKRMSMGLQQAEMHMASSQRRSDHWES